MTHEPPVLHVGSKYDRTRNPVCPKCEYDTHPIGRSAVSGELVCTHCIKQEVKEL